MPISHAAQPLYHRVHRLLAEEIELGALRPGDRLPSERSLCDTFGVSRATVRRAVEELVADGLIDVRGRGSFVTGGALAEPPNTLLSLTELGDSRGLQASALVLDSGVRAATLDEAEAFGIAPGAELFELERVRMLDGMPIALDHNRVPLRLAPGLGETDFAGASLYATLERSGHPPVRADYEVEARLVEGRAAELLGLEPSSPVLYTTTVAFGEDGRVLDVGRTIYRADRYRFQATLTRRLQRERGSSDSETLGTRVGSGRAGGDRHRRLWGDAWGGQAQPVH